MTLIFPTELSVLVFNVNIQFLKDLVQLTNSSSVEPETRLEQPFSEQRAKTTFVHYHWDVNKGN